MSRPQQKSGSKLDDYQLLESIGEGSFGKVGLCSRLSINSLAAVR